MTLLKNPIIAALLLQKLILPDLDDDSNTLKLYHEGIKKKVDDGWAARKLTKTKRTRYYEEIDVKILDKIV
ncbi:hypothetical protein V1477_008658 [Vespula maculifrons]|uniref:Uncharacterized protein n=1 Tax=Vespula maculifrons TaxID=7453 RepID=A0ABD2CDN6_VESMC